MPPPDLPLWGRRRSHLSLALAGGSVFNASRMMQNTTIRRRLAAECFLIFGVLPFILYLLRPHGMIYIILWVGTILAWRHTRYHGPAKWRELWNFAALTPQAAKSILWRFIPFAIALLLFTWLVIPDALFSLPRRSLYVWAMVMLLYPPLSAVPQEIIFRGYFFRRYRLLFRDQWMSVASALAFGWVHVVLQNWVAVVFSIIGGYIFSHTYRKTNSLAAVCFEHALYGCYIFTIGMGFYFYHGNQ